jgi:hypothetical protein
MRDIRTFVGWKDLNGGIRARLERFMAIKVFSFGERIF